MFERPWALWALPLALLPALIHWLSRRSLKRAPFGDLYLVREALSRARRASRLRDAGLLLARTGILLGLILSCAGPSASPSGSRGGAKPSESLSLLLWLDQSYSMRLQEAGETRFDAARAMGREALAALGPGDKAAVGFFSDRLELPPGGLRWMGREEAASLLGKAGPGFSGTDYAAPLAAGDVFLSSAPGRRVELLLTDGAAHGFRGRIPDLDSRIERLGLRWPDRPNAFLVRAAPSPSSAGGWRLLVEGRGLDRPRELRVWLGERPVGRSRLSPESPRAEIPLPIAGPGVYSGRAALRADDLPIDDERWFSFRLSSRPRVLVVYRDARFMRAPSGGYFLKRLCGGSESLIGYDCDFVESADLGSSPLSEYRAVLLADWASLPAATSDRLAGFAQAGGGLWVFPGEEGAAGKDLGGLEDLLGARFGPLVAADAPGAKASGSFWGGALDAFELSRVSFSAYRLLTVKPGSQVALRTLSGYPLEVVGQTGSGRIVVSAFGLGSRWGNAAMKPFFAPWVERSLRFLAPGPPRLETLGAVVGHPLKLSWPRRVAMPAAALVTDPDGRRVKVWVRERRAGFQGTARPGLYRVEDVPGGGVKNYAVNLDVASGESELKPAPSPPWTILRPESFRRDFDREIRGRPLSGPLLGFAALALIAEMFLALPWRSGSVRSRAAIFSGGARSGWRALAVAFTLLLSAAASSAAPAQEEADQFHFVQWRLGASWDPYPEAPRLILRELDRTTSVLAAPEPRVLELKDPALFFSPLLVLAGKESPPPLDADALGTLRDFLEAGGMLWIEDVSGLPESPFDRWVRATLARLRPGEALSPIPASNAVFRSFYLLRRPAGRTMVEPAIWGLARGRRWSVLYSRNDILGAWAVDPLGKPLFPCVPGGEEQRLESKRLAINIILYALTGNYKSDAVHQPYLLRKMREETLP